MSGFWGLLAKVSMWGFVAALGAGAILLVWWLVRNANSSSDEEDDQIYWQARSGAYRVAAGAVLSLLVLMGSCSMEMSEAGKAKEANEQEERPAAKAVSGPSRTAKTATQDRATMGDSPKTSRSGDPRNDGVYDERDIRAYMASDEAVRDAIKGWNESRERCLNTEKGTPRNRAACGGQDFEADILRRRGMCLTGKTWAKCS